MYVFKGFFVFTNQSKLCAKDDASNIQVHDGARIKRLDISLISLYCLFPGAVSEAQPNDNEYITKLCHDMFAKTADYLNGEFESNCCFLSGYLFSCLFV